jgi:hypothetical protein
VDGIRERPSFIFCLSMKERSLFQQSFYTLVMPSLMSCDCIDKIYDHCLHVMRQQLLEAHTTMYGLCFAYILEITRVWTRTQQRVKSGYNKETE